MDNPAQAASGTREANEKPLEKRSHFLNRVDYTVASCRNFGELSRAASL
jgi:hypothetical protein